MRNEEQRENNQSYNRGRSSLALAIVIAGYVAYKNSDAARIREQLDFGQHYLAEEN